MLSDAQKNAQSTKSVVRAARRSILYFGNEWSAENRTSSHHVATELSRHFDVQYIECPGLRAPSSSSRDIMRVFRKLRLGVSPPRRVADNLHVHTLLQLPFHRFSSIRRLNRWIVRASARRIARHRRHKEFWTWFTVPHAASIAGTLGEAKVIYYCIDDYPALPGVDVNAVTRMDEHLTKCADIVFVAAETMLPAKQKVNSNTFVSPHGVDVVHFRVASRSGPVPPDVERLPRPIIGFFGLIEAWIDLDLVEYLAKARPDWTFVMIGRVAVEHARAKACPNVYFLGQRDYGDLPSYGRSFDATIIPYRPTRQVQNANPLKLREYLAMGKPIVTVRTPEIEKFSHVVRIADTREEFLEQLEEAMKSDISDQASDARKAAVADAGWDTRVEWVVERIESGSSAKQLESVAG